ncbi:MAG TPA: hypothetical protein VNR00_20165, partial [Opitutus sp.]|nr:hypothetical protein [Opitutus sp.]
ATQAVTKAQSDSSAAVREAIAAALRDLAEAQNQALAAIDRKLAERTAAAVAAIEASLAKASTAVSPSITPAHSPAPDAFAAPPDDVAPTVKRPRKSRREEPEVATETASVPIPEAAPAESAVATAASATSDSAASTPSEPPAEAAEPAPVVAESISHIAPIAPASADPFGVTPVTVNEAEPANPVAEPAPAAAIEGEPVMAATAVEPRSAERPARKRSKAAPVDPTPDLFSQSSPDEFALAGDESPVTAGEAVESVMSSDGATRLIATAYIGIGNRLFIRGDGPGLSWDKGLPLQFISIGKWRWETSDPAGPIRFKLLKNDETESSLGSLTLEPGHQQEVTVKF